VGWLIQSESATLLSLWNGTKPVSASAPAISVTAPRPDPTTLDGLRSLATRGDPSAQFAMGAKYATGDEVSRDDQTAAQWFSQAAENGHVRAQSALGACYWVGRGVPKDLKRAYFWSFLASAGHDEVSEGRVKALARQLSRADVLEVEQQINEWLRAHNTQSGK
jgi:TPR repeat protein